MILVHDVYVVDDETEVTEAWARLTRKAHVTKALDPPGAKFMPHTDATIADIMRELEIKHAVLNKSDFERLQTCLGWNYCTQPIYLNTCIVALSLMTCCS